MARIGFIGLGNMGTPMAANLVRGGHAVMAYDISGARARQFAQAHAARATDILADLAAHAELGRLGPDFWLFDAGESDAFAIVMRYDAAGSVLGYERTTDVGWCSEQYAAAMAGSISLAEYLVRAR